MSEIATLRFFSCGRGDAILLEAANGEGHDSDWGLVDCNLTRSSGALMRMREVLDAENVKQLRFVCVSHPDLDHFFGLRELLSEWFVGTDGALRVNEFWDCGVAHSVLSAVAKRAGGESESKKLDDLYDYLVPRFYRDEVEYSSMCTCSEPDAFGQFRIKALAPRMNRVLRFNNQEVLRILRASDAESSHHIEEKNNLSVVLVLVHPRLPVNIVLGGDATDAVWNEALAEWEEYVQRTRPKGRRFSAVKVSHHGARTSLSKRLYDTQCWKKRTIAILSVGPSDPKHPHIDVLNVLKARNIRTYATCWRRLGALPRRRGVPLPGRAVVGASVPTHHMGGHDWADVVVRVLDDGRLKVSPPKSLQRLL